MDYIVREIQLHKLTGEPLTGDSKKIKSIWDVIFNNLEEVNIDDETFWNKDGKTFISETPDVLHISDNLVRAPIRKSGIKTLGMLNILGLYMGKDITKKKLYEFRSGLI